jgi:hypothetical protein
MAIFLRIPAIIANLWLAAAPVSQLSGVGSVFAGLAARIGCNLHRAAVDRGDAPGYRRAVVFP